MYRLVSQANDLEVLLDFRRCIFYFFLRFEIGIHKIELFPFYFAINFIFAFWEFKLYTQIYV